MEMPSPKRMRLEGSEPEASCNVTSPIDDMDDIYSTPPAQAGSPKEGSLLSESAPHNAPVKAGWSYSQLPGLASPSDDLHPPNDAEQRPTQVHDLFTATLSPVADIVASSSGSSGSQRAVHGIGENGNAVKNEQIVDADIHVSATTVPRASVPEVAIPSTDNITPDVMPSANDTSALHAEDQPLPKSQEVTSSSSTLEPFVQDGVQDVAMRADVEPQLLDRKPHISNGVDSQQVDDVVKSTEATREGTTSVEETNGDNALTVPTFEEMAVANKSSKDAEFEMDSSPYESSSSSDTSTSTSSSEDSDADDYEMLGPEEQARRLMAEDGGSDDDGPKKGAKNNSAPLRTQNEKPDEVVPMPDIVITEDMKIQELGQVENLVENVALIKANTSGEYQVLEIGSFLCLADRSIIGVISETLGRVQQPYYSVRFPNVAAIAQANVFKDSVVFYVEEHSKSVFTQPLKAFKGSDASNLHDEEVGDDELEFSDDEAEAEHKRQVKLHKRAKHDGRSLQNDGFSKGPQRLNNGQRNHNPAYSSNKGSNSNLECPPDPAGPSLNYDDADSKGISGHQDGEDLYTPLQRPSNLHEMIGKEPPIENRANRGSSHRGSRGHAKGARGGKRGQTRLRGPHNVAPGPRHEQQNRDGGDGRNYHQNQSVDNHRLSQTNGFGLPPRPPPPNNGQQPTFPQSNSFQPPASPSQSSSLRPPSHQTYNPSMLSHSHQSFAAQYPAYGQPYQTPQYPQSQYPHPNHFPSNFQTFQPFPSQPQHATYQVPPTPASPANIPPGAHVNPAFFWQQAQAPPPPWGQ